MIGIAPASPPVVTLDNLVKFFGRFAAIRGISASFAPGRLYVVLGDNGAGKSTLLRMIAGLMEPSQGSFTLLGTQKHREVAHRVGYMGHAPLLYDELSGMENLRYFAGLYGLDDDALCRKAMEMVGLDAELSRRVGQYSQGMRQRLSLARAVLHDPELILLDEPFSNVDLHSAREMAAVLGQSARPRQNHLCGYTSGCADGRRGRRVRTHDRGTDYIARRGDPQSGGPERRVERRHDHLDVCRARRW